MQALCRFVGKISNICGKIGEVMSIILMLMIFGSILVGVFSRTFTDWGCCGRKRSPALVWWLVCSSAVAWP